MRIAEGIHLFTSGGLGFDLTDSYDCNTYLVRAGEDWILFDAGAGYRGSIDAALSLAASEGVDAARIRHLFLTHGHADHSGGASALSERLSGLTVCAGAATAALVSTGDEAGISLGRARAAGIYPGDYLYRPCRIDRVIEDGETVAIGDATVTAVSSPGHSHDHVCYLVSAGGNRLLVAGDAIFHGGRITLQDTHDCSVPESCATIRRLAAVEFEVLLPGHGPFSLRDGQRHVRAAMCYIERLLCPPSLV